MVATTKKASPTNAGKALIFPALRMVAMGGLHYESEASESLKSTSMHSVSETELCESSATAQISVYIQPLADLQ